MYLTPPCVTTFPHLFSKNFLNNDTYVNTYTNSTAIGNGARMTASHQVRIGNSSVTSIGGYEPWTDVSDGRFKNDVQENVPGLAFIIKLRPVTYHLDVNALATQLNKDILDARGVRINQADETTIAARNAKSSVTKTGFIAQEVEVISKEIGFDFSGVDIPEDGTGLYGLRYSQFVVPLVKAVQEQQVLIQELKSEIEELKKKMP